MSATATIESINLSPDGTGSGAQWLVTVLINDTVSGFTETKTYSFPITETIQQAKIAIQTDLNTINGLITEAGQLQQYVGTVLT